MAGVAGFPARPYLHDTQAVPRILHRQRLPALARPLHIRRTSRSLAIQRPPSSDAISYWMMAPEA
jgi:hypothetical protein